MIILRKYNADDANEIVKWINDEYSFRQWCADRYSKYPIDANDINNYYGKNQNDFLIFTAVNENNNIVGHFILRYPNPNDKSTVRLGFVIVNCMLRGKGVGKQMLEEAISYTFNTLNADRLTIGVFENNINALKCYKSCGFSEIGEINQYNCLDETWNCIEMQILNNKM